MYPEEDALPARDRERVPIFVVGKNQSTTLGGREAFRWTQTTAMVGLGDLVGGRPDSSARDVSADGLVVVGSATSPSIPVASEAFRWTEAGGMVGLGHLRDGSGTLALGVSGDGSIVVGTDLLFGHPDQAFIWDAKNGMRALDQVLVNDYGVDLSGWNLSWAEAISPDGLTIIGYGRSRNSDHEAWIARLAVVPEPSTALLVGSGLVGMTLLRRRAR